MQLEKSDAWGRPWRLSSVEPVFVAVRACQSRE